MGAAGVAVAAARRRRIHEIVDAFRLADATAADRAMRLDTLALTPNGELQSLIDEGLPSD